MHDRAERPDREALERSGARTTHDVIRAIVAPLRPTRLDWVALAMCVVALGLTIYNASQYPAGVNALAAASVGLATGAQIMRVGSGIFIGRLADALARMAREDA